MLKELAMKLSMIKPSPRNIPMSRPRCMDNDFYSVEVYFPNLSYEFNCRERHEKGITGWLWVEGGEGVDASLLTDCFEEEKYSLTIERYYKCKQYNYKSSLRFLFNYYLRAHRVKHFVRSISQAFFNQKELVTADRIDLLKYMFHQTKEQENYRVSVLFYGAELYGERFLFHPKRRKWTKHIELVFDSLVESGELKKTSSLQYELTPRALVTISEYELSEKHHLDNVSNSRKITRLTFAIVLIGFLTLLLDGFIWLHDNYQSLFNGLLR
ncbi:hypothetical protein HYO28_22045 [Vibrio parahaemolyticus]|nr:hypothetical protein [Vibrio parahaemolyticus]